MTSKIQMIWKAGGNHPAYGLNPRDRILELEDGQCLLLRSVDQSRTGFELTSLGDGRTGGLRGFRRD